MAGKRKLTAEQEKEIKLLQANNEMLEKTKEEARMRGNEKSVERIQIAQDDVIEQLKKLGQTPNFKIEHVEEEDEEINLIDMGKEEESIFDTLNELNKANENTSTIMEEINRLGTSFEFNNVDSDAQYDVISLPSNGECYGNKMERVPVAYLTAYDENFLTSPNLYHNGMVIDFLLKHKIMNSNINIDELVSGDVDAIVLFLRATSYGVEFPITARDPESGEAIESVVDLTTLKAKEFNLKGDENGWFEYELPISKDKVKFRYLTRKDEKNLRLLANLENETSKITELKRIESVLRTAVREDKVLDGNEKKEHFAYLEKLKEWEEKISKSKSTPYSKLITNRLEMNVMSVNGNTDRKFISKYVKNMSAMDSLKLRRYILENEPGIDFEIEVERPQNLGGGSFKTFLEWGDDVFFNIK